MRDTKICRSKMQLVGEGVPLINMEDYFADDRSGCSPQKHLYQQNIHPRSFTSVKLKDSYLQKWEPQALVYWAGFCEFSNLQLTNTPGYQLDNFGSMSESAEVTSSLTIF